MWTSIHLATHQVWDDLLWSVTALWDEGDGTPPVALTKQGQCPLHGADAPHDMLAAALKSMSDELMLASDELLRD